jgi:hypothetical protein
MRTRSLAPSAGQKGDVDVWLAVAGTQMRLVQAPLAVSSAPAIRKTPC